MKNLLNLSLVVCVLVVLGCKCQQTLDEIKNQAQAPSPTVSPSASPTATKSESDSKSEDSKSENSKSDSKRGLGVTKAAFEKIKNGMSVEEINEITGTEGEEIYSSESAGIKSAAYKWEGPDYATITASFSNNKLTSKFQANLK